MRKEELFFDQGCTIVFVIIIEDKIYVANLGDSEAITFDKEGNVVRILSKIHSPEDKKEIKRIEKALINLINYLFASKFSQIADFKSWIRINTRHQFT